MIGYTAFDIEISTVIPDGETDWKAHRPLGISCAATLDELGKVTLWHGAEQPDGRLAERMAPEELDRLVEHLVGRAEMGVPVLTWNGLGFDLAILQEECSPGHLRDFVHIMARCDHIDMMFQFFCEKGFPLALNTAAKGMGLAGKTAGMHGELAPVMWAQGREEQNRVLEYVAQDVVTTADVYKAILHERFLRWTTKAGRLAVWQPTLKLNGDVREPRMLTVEECLALPEPDTSWMTGERWTRAKFAGWLKSGQAQVETPIPLERELAEALGALLELPELRPRPPSAWDAFASPAQTARQAAIDRGLATLARARAAGIVE